MFSTNVAFIVRSASWVTQLVHFKNFTAAKQFPILIALEWLFSSVNSHVAGECLVGSNFFITKFTRKLLLSGVRKCGYFEVTRLGRRIVKTCSDKDVPLCVFACELPNDKCELIPYT